MIWSLLNKRFCPYLWPSLDELVIVRKWLFAPNNWLLSEFNLLVSEAQDSERSHSWKDPSQDNFNAVLKADANELREKILASHGITVIFLNRKISILDNSNRSRQDYKEYKWIS